MFVQKKCIFSAGVKQDMCCWCNPDPSSPRVLAMAEHFPCSCQSDAPHCSVVFIADETAPCRWPLSSLMGAKAVSQEPTSKTHKHAHTHTYFTISKGLWRIRELVKSMAGSFFLAAHCRRTRMGKEWVQMYIMWKATWSAIRIPARDSIHVITPPHRSYSLHHPSHANTHTHTHTHTHTPALVQASLCRSIPHLSVIPIKTYWERLSISCSKRQTTLSLKLIRTSLSPPTAHIAMETQPRVVTWYWQNRKDEHRERGRGVRFPLLLSDPWFWALLQPRPDLHFTAWGECMLRK